MSTAAKTTNSNRGRFVLLETLASATRKHPLWFARMTAIGPMTTPDSAERAVFESEEAARQCPAMWHAFSFYEPVALDGEQVA